MSTTRVPPAHPRLERQAEVERLAYKRMVRGQLTAAQFLAAIVPVRKSGRWRRGR